MTKFLPLLFFVQLFAAIKADGQIFYSQTFDNIPGPTENGSGTYIFPPAFFLRNVDNRIPDISVDAINDAWERLDDIAGDTVALSTSWYTPAGAANDFMWTPAIALTGNNITLNWNAVAYDADFPDGYEVRIMTVEPTGGLGVIGNQLTNSTLLLTVPGENADWNARSLDLNAYSGQTVYIGFRNNSNDQFILAIDDIVVQNNSVVAINSLSLSGNYQNGKNVLKWSVKGTDDRYDLSLQNSMDGLSWKDIYHDVYTTGKADFSYSHTINAEKSFYRVKAITPSGKIYISNTILVSQKNNGAILLYPSLASGNVIIQGNISNATLQIIDAAGKTMLSERVKDDSKALNVSAWPAGIYFVRIFTKEHNTYYRKLVVKH